MTIWREPGELFAVTPSGRSRPEGLIRWREGDGFI